MPLHSSMGGWSAMLRHSSEKGGTMKMFQKFKEPRTLLVLVIVLAACGFGGLAILSQVSANPAFCVSCHNMQPEYDSYAQGNLLAKQHADASVTCHDCHEPTLLRSTAIRMSSVSPATPLRGSNRRRHAMARKTRMIPSIWRAMRIRRTVRTAIRCIIRSRQRNVRPVIL